MTAPKVSILCITYNHGRYIRQTLESFFAQKTNFEYEVLVHDDASTDNTVEIIKKFQKKYSTRMTCIFQAENQFSKGVHRLLSTFLLPRAQGKYLALCEGDDYFVDEHKLQFQSDWLESHPTHTICFHPVRVIYEGLKIRPSIFPKKSDIPHFSIEELLKQNFIQTNSVMYRKQDYAGLTKESILPGDWYLHLFHARFGKIGFINKIMAVYRRHKNGLWYHAKDQESLHLKKYGTQHVRMFIELIKLFGNDKKQRKIILNNIADLLHKLIAIDRREPGSALVENVFKAIPILFHLYFSEIITLQDQNNSNYTGLLLSRIQKSHFYKLWRVYCKIKEHIFRVK